MSKVNLAETNCHAKWPKLTHMTKQPVMDCITKKNSLLRNQRNANKTPESKNNIEDDARLAGP